MTDKRDKQHDHEIIYKDLVCGMATDDEKAFASYEP